MSENRNGAAASNGAPAAPAAGDDLRSTIAGALADSLAVATSPPGAAETGSGPEDPPPPERPAAGGPADPPAGGEQPGARPVGEAGSGPAAPAGGEAPGAAPGAAAGETPPAGAESAPAAAEAHRSDAGAPVHWSATDRDEFNALPEAARAPFLRMYKRMESAFTPRLQRGAQLERDYGELDRTVFTGPQRELVARNGQTLTGIVQTWANIERALDRGTNPNNPALRNGLIARIIHNYGADPGEIARELNQLRGFPTQQGGDMPAGNGAGAGNGAPALPAPGVPATSYAAPAAAVPNALEARFNALETDYNTRRLAEDQARGRALQNQIAEFANAKGADGALLHPFFAEVRADMAALAQLEEAQGQNPALDDLYDRAVWARPSTREKLLVSQRDAETKRAADERKAKAEAAKKAGVSVNGAPGPGQAPQSAPDRSLRDEIRAQVGAAAR